MFILSNACQNTLNKIMLPLRDVVKSRSLFPLSYYLSPSNKQKSNVRQKQQFSAVIHDLTKHLQQNLSKATETEILEQLSLKEPILHEQLVFYVETLIPVWEKLLLGNIMFLYNHLFAISASPQLLSAAGSLLLLVEQNKVLQTRSFELEDTKFYLKQLLDGNILIDTLENALI